MTQLFKWQGRDQDHQASIGRAVFDQLFQPGLVLPNGQVQAHQQRRLVQQVFFWRTREQ
ncbi:hypothetical protein D3C73_1647780 [compost metagenome]